MTIATKKTRTRATTKKRATAKKTTTQPATAKRTAINKAVVKKVTAKRPVLKKITKQAKPAHVQPNKIKKPKLVRDSFTIPKDEYVVIDSLKTRAIQLGQAVKKSELLRAGIKALAAMSDIQFKAALSNVPPIKTGRPKKTK